MRYFLVLMVSFASLISCTTRQVEPSRASRRAIDTIYQQKILALQPHMDSVCAHLHDSLYTVAVDSILTIRRMEMNELVE